MSVLNPIKRPTDMVRVWDGTEYSMMQRKTAEQLMRQRKVQLTENLQAKDLKTKAEFDAPKPRKKKKAYENKEMTSEMDAD